MITEFHIFEGSNDGFLTGTAAADWCNSENVRNFVINRDGSVDVNGNLYITTADIRVQFGAVRGILVCTKSGLSSWRGMPRVVTYNMNVTGCALTDTEGAPAHVGGHVWLDDNGLETLEGTLKYVGGEYLDLRGNNLTDMTGYPDAPHVKTVNLESSGIRSLRGMPETVHGNLLLDKNRLVDLDGGPKVLHGTMVMRAGNNGFRSLKGAPTVFDNIEIEGPNIEEGVVQTYKSTIAAIPRAMRESLAKVQIHAVVAKKSPVLAAYLFDDGNVPDANIEDVESISNFL